MMIKSSSGLGRGGNGSFTHIYHIKGYCVFMNIEHYLYTKFQVQKTPF